MNTAIKRIQITVFLFFTIIFHSNSYAASGVMLSPLRVDFSDSKKYSTVSIINQDRKKPIKFQIHTQPMRMDENGQMYVPEKPNARELIAQKLIRYSPSTAIIPGGKKQVVRLMTKKPNNLPPGEYLTYFSVVPEQVDSSNSKQNSGKLSLNLEVMLAVQIPIVVRHGDLKFDVKPTDVKFYKNKDGQVYAKVVVNRTGNRSCIIAASMQQVLPSGKVIELGQNQRSVIYLPITNRNIRIPVETPQTLNKGGKIRIILLDNENDKKELSRTEFPL